MSELSRDERDCLFWALDFVERLLAQHPEKRDDKNPTCWYSRASAALAVLRKLVAKEPESN